MSVITGQIPPALDTATLPDRPGLHAAGQRHRAGAMGVLLRPRRHRHQPRRHATTGTARSRQRQRRRSELERDRPEADPGRRHRHRHPRPRQDHRGAEVDGRVPPETAATTSRPPRARRPVQPERQQRLQRRAPAQLQQRWRPRSPSALRPSLATVPPASAANTAATQQHRRRPQRRQRGRHHLRRHRRVRRASRRRMGRAAGRRPQLLVLRQLRLAQPRQLRPATTAARPGLLSGRIPAQLHAGAQRRRQAASADDRRWPAHRQHLRPPAARSSTAWRSSPASSYPIAAGARARSVADAGGQRRGRTTPTRTQAGCATMGEKLKMPPGRRDSWWGWWCAIRPAPTIRPTPSPIRRCCRSAINQPLNTPVLDHIDLIRGLVHGLQDAGRTGLRRRVAAQHQLAARRRHDGGSVGGSRRREEHHRGGHPDLQRQRAPAPGRA